MSITLKEISKVFRVSDHAIARMKHRTNLKSINDLKMDLVKSIDRMRIQINIEGKYVVTGGFAKYILSRDLCVISVLCNKSYKDIKMYQKPLNRRQKISLLNKIKKRILNLYKLDNGK